MLSDKKASVLLLLSAGLSLGIYICAGCLTYRIGFPLDDAWIHQTYARNLALRGEWAFIPGSLSGGSTAPLWTFLLAPGYYLPGAPYLWTYVLGWLLLAGMAYSGYRYFRLLRPDGSQALAMTAGLMLVFEWHLVWAAASGMETLLFSLVVLFLLIYLSGERRSWMLVGLLIGTSAWIRPDGITLALPAMLALTLAPVGLRQKVGGFCLLVAGLALTTGAYVWFNWQVGGSWFPNTFYAKQTEYAIERSMPLLIRLAEQAALPLIGVGVCLLPGFMFFCGRLILRRSWVYLIAPAWAVGYLCLYALRLPVTYQHGRYVIPMMPVYFLWGFTGLIQLINVRSPRMLSRVLSRAWFIATSLVLVAFWLLGARAYGRDVALIESEMVDTARWLAQNTEAEAVIAAHDIGAIGYFGERKLLDLAGLVSPEVIPFLRDEDQLAEYLDQKGATYLVTFPGWYPRLTLQATPVYQTNGKFSPELGGENMVVYKWR